MRVSLPISTPGRSPRLSCDARPSVAYIDFDTRTLAVAACNGEIVFKDGFD